MDLQEAREQALARFEAATKKLAEARLSEAKAFEAFAEETKKLRAASVSREVLVAYIRGPLNLSADGARTFLKRLEKSVGL